MINLIGFETDHEFDLCEIDSNEQTNDGEKIQSSS